jgi:muramoyltetrapeptide carboxypeptidase
VGAKDDALDGHGHAEPVVPDDIMEDCFNDLVTWQGEGTGWRQHAEPRPAQVQGSLAKGEWTINNAPLWGGNLTLVSSLLGTPYFPEIKGGVLFLEDVAEHPYRVERMLTQLLHAGVLARQKAVTIS